MKLKSFKFAAAIVAALAGCLSFNLSTATTAQAGIGDIVDTVSDELANIDPTNPNSSVSPLMNFRICNQTGHTVPYNINTSAQSIAHGVCYSYGSYPVGSDISFDWSYAGGYQREWYDIGHGQTLTFRRLSNGAGIDLY